MRWHWADDSIHEWNVPVSWQEQLDLSSLVEHDLKGQETRGIYNPSKPILVPAPIVAALGPLVAESLMGDIMLQG
ncbi:hypothetical protein ACLOJK_026664 [Asimina triloba]